VKRWGTYDALDALSKRIFASLIPFFFGYVVIFWLCSDMSCRSDPSVTWTIAADAFVTLSPEHGA
jgi:hypothetical protein